ncbi:MAG TPA: protein kinase [Longimicrobiales bacterium]|nr:protein kinase [Longimicrobiales bacterium]
MSDPFVARLATALADHYRIEEEIGRGGFSTIYAAQDLKHARRVAVKVLAPELAASLGSQRFLREIRVTAKLQHPHILPLLDSGERAGFLYYVMPYVAGESLRSRLDRDGRLSLAEATRFARDIADALDYAHRQGIVHRDVKPENILLSDSQAMLADFGVARAIVAASEERMTRTGLAVGSPLYMSPEQIAGEGALDGRSDVYSLACVLFEMLVGHPPYTATTVEKVALQHLSAPSPSPRAGRPEIPRNVHRAILRGMAKDSARRFETAGAFAAAIAPEVALARRETARRWAVGGTAAAVLVVGMLYFMRTERLRAWARNDALPEAAELVERRQHYEALRLLREVEAILPEDPLLHQLLTEATMRVAINSRPRGASVRVRDVNDPPDQWELLGETPLRDVRIPSATLVYRISREGFETRTEVRVFPRDTLEFELQPASEVPADMVFVPRGLAAEPGRGFLHIRMPIALDPFLIDRYEVTNERYLEFVNGGGYAREELWVEALAATGFEWEMIQARFRDSTGQPGPANWELGRYPPDHGNHPVTGVSWLEAWAFCAAAGKRLPTLHHWLRAADFMTTSVYARDSNFAGSGTRPVGRPRAIGAFGTYDLAGNAKEWVATAPDSERRYILGGGWNEPDYQYTEYDAQAPASRSVSDGFRCARYPETQAVLNAAVIPFPVTRAVDMRPVGDEVYAAYGRLYAYDPIPLDARVESSDDRAADWRVERVTFTAAYGNERVPAVLFLPANTPPPYQTVIYFPGAGAFMSGRLPFEDAQGQREWFLFLVRTGRAVMFPIYKGMYQRHMGQIQHPNEWRDFMVYAAKDLMRSVDYLSSRPDIDTTRIAYFGFSAGASMGLVLTAVERRLRASVLLAGGLPRVTHAPEADPANFLPRINVPTLMINGRNDFFFPYETSQLPAIRGLGTAAEDRLLCTFESGHIPPTNEVRRLTLAWLERYLGPVNDGSTRRDGQMRPRRVEC